VSSGERFKVTGLDHVNVTSPQELEDEVLDWYREVLGLEQLEKPQGTRGSGGWFRVGHAELHVSVDPQNPTRSSHFCLVVDDFDSTVARLRGEGCHIEQASEIEGRRRLFTRDPAGNRIELTAFDAST
jgi:catechol 2,3-dioxygenase-like lactoylglutathione lyase family enzyme